MSELTKILFGGNNDWDALRDEFKEEVKQHWKDQRKAGRKMGRPRAIETPETLWKLFCDYGEDTDANPIIKHEVVKGGDNAGKVVRTPLQRPYTWAGFSSYVFIRGIAADLEKYRFNENGAYEDFRGVISAIGNFMYKQKFEGAAVGMFKENLIARELNIREKQETELSGNLNVTAPTINVYSGNAPGFASSESEIDLQRDEQYKTRD